MVSRVGRDKQRYGVQGERLVAGIVPLSTDGKRVLVIASSRNKGWVLPKGGWETDEEADEAAKREAWEEAGIEVDITRPLGVIPDRTVLQHQQPTESGSVNGDTGVSDGAVGATSKEQTRSNFYFYEANVRKEHDTYPEMRQRRWLSYHKAAKKLAKRPELLEALDRSSIDKTADTGGDASQEDETL